MIVITLTTDWKEDDFYSGSVKGAILSKVPEATIIDISHQVKPFNTFHAAFILRNSFPHFPQGTIHLIGVNTEKEKGRSHLVVKAEGQYFIGTDNGIFSLIFKDPVEQIIEIKPARSEYSSFPMLHTFIDIAAHIAKGKDMKELGSTVKDFQKKIPLRATIDDSIITGGILYIDSYRNAITNISKELFERVGNNRPFELFVQSNSYKIKKINTAYHETTPGELLALFNSLNLLEIAINKGNAADLLNLSTNSSIRIKFQ